MSTKHHTANAYALIDLASEQDQNGPSALGGRLLAAAQVHATLALVQAQEDANEQARIANLIALVSLEGESAIPVARALVEADEVGNFVSYRPDIAAALRIEDEA